MLVKRLHKRVKPPPIAGNGENGVLLFVGGKGFVVMATYLGYDKTANLGLGWSICQKVRATVHSLRLVDACLFN